MAGREEMQVSLEQPPMNFNPTSFQGNSGELSSFTWEEIKGLRDRGESLQRAVVIPSSTCLLSAG